MNFSLLSHAKVVAHRVQWTDQLKWCFKVSKDFSICNNGLHAFRLSIRVDA